MEFPYMKELGVTTLQRDQKGHKLKRSKKKKKKGRAVMMSSLDTNVFMTLICPVSLNSLPSALSDVQLLAHLGCFKFLSCLCEAGI